MTWVDVRGAGLVRRIRLEQLLDPADSPALTLVRAPAGIGIGSASTASWVAEQRPP